MKTLTAFYDFEVSPASYDFLVFLCTTGIAAKVTEQDHVHIVFVPAGNQGGFRQDHKPTTVSNREWRRDHLLVPLGRLLGASHTVCHSREQAELFQQGASAIWPPHYRLDQPTNGYWFGALRKLYERAGFIPDLVPTEEARNFVKAWLPEPFRPYVTITLRETYTGSRNSNRPAWDRFRKWVYHEKGYWVVIVPDTEKAASVDGIGAISAVNPMIRAALYEQAAMNLGINNGPMGLCWYTKAPYLTFKMITDDWVSTKPEFFERMGLPVGTQFPWANERQRLVWEDDEFETIKERFLEVMGDEHKHVLRA